jgi:site-specific recombinase XerD
MTNPVTALYEQVERENAAKEGRILHIVTRRVRTPMPDTVDQHPAGAYLISTQTAMSRQTAFSALNTVSRLLGQDDIKGTPWHTLRYHEVNMVRSLLAEHYAPATANKILSILRGVLRQAWKLGMMSADEYKRTADVPSIPGTRLPTGHALSRGEVDALFGTCAEPGPEGARDAALLAILIGCGLRRTEASQLDLEHVDTTESTLRVIGKGNHERIAHMNAGVTDAVNAWLQIRGNAQGALLRPLTGRGGRITTGRLCTESIRLILKRRAKQARIRPCTPHDLRRTFITTLLDHGNDVAIASRMAGHRNISTTTRYDRRNERANRDAAATLHVPYQAPPDTDVPAR